MYQFSVNEFMNFENNNILFYKNVIVIAIIIGVVVVVGIAVGIVFKFVEFSYRNFKLKLFSIS